METLTQQDLAMRDGATVLEFDHFGDQGQRSRNMRRMLDSAKNADGVARPAVVAGWTSSTGGAR